MATALKNLGNVVLHAWTEEAGRRKAEIRSGKVKSIPAADVYRRIDQLLKK